MKQLAALALLAALAPDALARPKASQLWGESRRARLAEKFKPETRQYRRGRELDLERVIVRVEPDLSSGTIRAKATVEGRVLARTLGRLELDAVRLAVTSVRDAERGKLEFEVLPEKLAVVFDAPLKTGDTVRLEIEYTAEPKMGLYFFKPDPRYPGQPLQMWSQGEPEEARHWIPIYDYPNERTASEIVVTVPKGLVAVSNGRLKSKTPAAGGGTEFHWAQDKPHVPYLITLVVGDLALVEEDWKGVPLRYYVPPDRKGDVQRTFGQTKDMLSFFSQRLEEPYPWDQYAQLALYEFGGGMENTSATSLTERVLLDERARVDNDWAEDLNSHELAHQWFGDLLTCKDWANLWLNEGITSYFQALYREHWKGTDEFHYDMAKKARDVFGEGYERAIVTTTYEFPWAMFDAHTYDKGAWVLHMLRQSLGEDAFWRSFKAYIREHRHGVVETEDLRRAVEATTGDPMLEFFDQWLYGPGQPTIEASLEWDAKEKKAKLLLVQKQAKPFHVKLPVEIHGLLKTYKFTADLEKAEQTFEWELGGRPRRIRIDPEGTVLRKLALKLPLDMLSASLEKDAAVPARLDALEAIKGLGGSQAVAAISKALKGDAFWGVRLEAASALGELGGADARGALLEALREPDAKVRAASAGALGRYVLDETVFDALAKASTDDASWNVRSSALASLGRLKLEKAKPILEAAMDVPSWNETTRGGAAAGLAALRDPATLPRLREWSAPGRPPLARRRAMGALAAVSELREAEATRVGFERVLETETDEGTLEAAIAGLTTLGDPAASPALGRLAAREEREGLKRSAAEAVDSIREGRKGKVAELTEQVDRLRLDIERLWKKLDEKR